MGGGITSTRYRGRKVLIRNIAWRNGADSYHLFRSKLYLPIYTHYTHYYPFTPIYVNSTLPARSHSEKQSYLLETMADLLFLFYYRDTNIQPSTLVQPVLPHRSTCPPTSRLYLSSCPQTRITSITAPLSFVKTSIKHSKIKNRSRPKHLTSIDTG